MKVNSTLVLLLASVAVSISACKKDKQSEPDYSNCQLYKAEYTSGSKESYKPFVYGNFQIEYDNENRISKQTWESNWLTYRYEPGKMVKNSSYSSDSTVYKKDNNGRIKYHIDYPEMDSTTYDYDSEGYLIRKSVYKYTYGQIWLDYRYAYSNGNLVQEICDMYYAPGTRLAGSDTLTYTYDNTPWFPESIYLYQTPNFLTGKPNKNNITGIQLKAYELSLNTLYRFPYIHYSYFVKGNRLEKVIIDTDPRNPPLEGSDTMSVAFTYKCN